MPHFVMSLEKGNKNNSLLQVGVESTIHTHLKHDTITILKIYLFIKFSFIFVSRKKDRFSYLSLENLYSKNFAKYLWFCAYNISQKHEHYVNHILA